MNNLLTQNLILHTISNQESHARQEYRRFVESAIGIELDNPLKDTYGGIILGKTEFIKETLRKVKETVLQVEEISNRKALKSKYNMTELIEILADYFNVNKGEIIESNNSDLRRIAIYLIKKNTGATNNKIGNYFGGITYSAVAKVCERFKKTIKKNERLKRKIAEIERELSKVNRLLKNSSKISSHRSIDMINYCNFKTRRSNC